MKKMILLSALLLMGTTALAQEGARCRVITGDVGEIRTIASTQTDAFKQAVKICVSRRTQLFKAVRGQEVTADRYQDFIDSCVNLTCKK